MLISDHRLPDPAASFNNVYQIINDPIFQTHDDIQIAQTNITINANNFLTPQSQ
jgi:hypothetical protein